MTAGLAFALSGKGDLGPIPAPRRLWITALIDRPALWNAFCILVRSLEAPSESMRVQADSLFLSQSPALPVVPVLLTGCISAYHTNVMWDRHAAWQDAFGQVPTVSREMLLGAAEIWNGEISDRSGPG